MLDLSIPCIGVTGTNGKTTVTYLLAQLFEGAGLIGTLGAGFVDDLQATGYTTPPQAQTDHVVLDLVSRGAKALVMEVSSHSLVQQRAAHVPFETAVFTNLTAEHLDYHGDMEQYCAAKQRLFAWPTLKYAVVNKDDPYHQHMLDPFSETVITYSCLDNTADIALLSAEPTGNGYDVVYQTPLGELRTHLPLMGCFNLSNFAAVIGVALQYGFTLNHLAINAPHLRAPAGRMEVVQKTNPAVVIDYAHTEDALAKVIDTLRAHCHGKLWVVFGCGGDRDRSKRPLMAKAAERADHVIVTEDNPRFESIEQIMADILVGFTVNNHRVIPSRKAAIVFALENAAEDDMILLAGKGHETYMDVEGEKHFFSEREIVNAALAHQVG